MFIKEIILDGFKCYEERTVVAGIDCSFNAITGMNGSGKSNVLDGVLFALGLETARALRADSLKELVNVHRSECRVDVVFCNKEKSRSPLGYEHCDEIRVSRAIDADGRTKHYLNGHVCTQSALGKFCMSMGLQSRGMLSSVVMQGHITRILSMRSEDLKNLVGEAAGTRCYENEKEKAMQAIAKKEEKLREVSEMLQRRISPFYGKLREERTRYVESRDIDERKKRLMDDLNEVCYLMCMCDAECAVRGLIEYMDKYSDEFERVEQNEEMIENMRRVDEEGDVMWAKTAMDEEKLKIEEMRSKRVEEMVIKKEQELAVMKEANAKYDMNELIARENVLVESLGDADAGLNDVVSKAEELANLRHMRSKIDVELGLMGDACFWQDKLEEIERLRVDEDELERMRKKLYVMKSRINYPFIEGVFGTVDENFEICDMKYFEAICVAMGGRGKYVITSDEKVGGIVLNGADRSVSVIPLSKIRVNRNDEGVEKAIRMEKGIWAVDLLRFDGSVRKAIEFVFGGFFVFEDKEVAKKMCFENKVMCITVDGTVYDPRGMLSGGKNVVRVEVVRRKEIEAIGREVERLTMNKIKFDELRGEYEEMLRMKEVDARRKVLAEEKRKIDARMSVISDVYGEKIDIRNELKVVRENMITAKREMNEIKRMNDRRRELKEEIKVLEEMKKKNDEEMRMCEQKICEYQKIVEGYEEKMSMKSMNDDEIEKLEEMNRGLKTEIGRIKNKIMKVYGELEKRMKEACTEWDVFDKSVAIGNRLKDVIMQLRLDERYFCIRRVRMSEKERQMIVEKKLLIEEQLMKLGGVKRSTMDPANFDLLERNELMVEDLQDKIHKLEKDKLAINQSVMRLDDLGLSERRKAFKHINGRLGKFLRYFIPDSDARIDEEAGEYVLRVKVGSWKECLEELSGGQRSLVALSLIFSMLTYRPSPFYVFDEIDSALDLSHTQSIGEIIRNEFGNAQFLVVSLKNGMFDNANSIFKVFMHDGKSRICKIK
ncbi:chromosome segregation ATPase [Ordospora colligata]|uniref:Chromosome segregation ATPase n=1 Tax=Ordospora colligata OC4 TaxID=1354746 RepID=A0A0B2UNB3_9MICR|nr:chromosome segregation ATPase [Ordospora colligata OC4]KHN70455.1 chromosome segregation ATPase [Ordospora colligata OC4]TBU17205.1 chromosome segregation ATPase [Ordospora colligata]TBU17455.1 chromosome segregation ATPase [Ordospora colligata]TBU19635.1 chromosome segregation ATPase [Ordospora colligata]